MVGSVRDVLRQPAYVRYGKYLIFICIVVVVVFYYYNYYYYYYYYNYYYYYYYYYFALISMISYVTIQPQYCEGYVRVVPSVWSWGTPPAHTGVAQKPRPVSNWLWSQLCIKNFFLVQSGSLHH